MYRLVPPSLKAIRDSASPKPKMDWTPRKSWAVGTNL